MNLDRSALNVESSLQVEPFLESLGINEHLIILSVDEIFQNNKYLLWLNQFHYYSRLFTTIDPTVIIINQIMFTFFRNDIYCTERMRSE